MPRSLIGVLLVILAACSKSSPTDPSPTAASGLLEGQTVNAIDGSPSAHLSVQVGTERATSDVNGLFQVDVGGPGSYRTIVRGSGIVERETTVSGPTGERARLSLMPASFDIAAFDEMFRASNARLQRWTTRPSLVVLARVMVYRNAAGNEYVAGSEELTADEIEQMIAHLTEGLALLSGNTFSSFASVDVETPEAGARVNVLRRDHIVVGRYTGIVTLANTIGYGQWLETPEGTVAGGAMYLDRDFDRGDGRRRLLRIHELGHALGYQHVRSRTSIMNPSIGPEPTDFDRAAAVVAFQRPVGNRAPDIDPAASGRLFSTAEGAGARWVDPIYCR